MGGELLAVVDVEQPMSDEMRDALIRLEADCTCDGRRYLTETDARNWLRRRFSHDLAEEFRPEMMVSSRVP